MSWFFLALGAAVANSFVQASQKWLVSVSRYSKITVAFFASLLTALSLFFISLFLVGLPETDGRFWLVVTITGVLNFIAFPIMLKAYEIGEFSSVYSMILLSPVFLLVTSFFFLGEAPSLTGLIGVVLTVVGLIFVSMGNDYKDEHRHNFIKGNWLGIAVALIWSVSINFDKLSAQYSDPVFAPAVILAIMSLGYALYFLVKRRSLFNLRELITPASTRLRTLVFGMIGLCVLMVLSNVLHNAALLQGFASYTIAVKRSGVLLGVVRGWLFFKEKAVGKKLFGAAIAVSGVIAIILS